MEYIYAYTLHNNHVEQIDPNDKWKKDGENKRFNNMRYGILPGIAMAYL